jgi:mannosyl-3-phosphoglycerate phosphatase
MQLLKNRKAIVVFTDLDGTLLDHNYSFTQTQPMINCLLSLGVRMVFCSSKTKSEIEFYRRRMGVKDPFISENGACIFVPKNYFSKHKAYSTSNGQYDLIELGTPYSVIRKTFEKLRETCGFTMIGFGDLTLKEIVATSGLSESLAKLAKKREYTEPFLVDQKKIEEVLEAIRREGLVCVKGGRFFHLSGKHDKGEATGALKKLFANELGEVVSVGVGDQLNDLCMLNVVDIPIMIKDRPIRDVWKDILKKIVSFQN